MNSLDPPQLEIAHILFELPTARGFALAGGSALLALGAINRPTRDSDSRFDQTAAGRPSVIHLPGPGAVFDSP